jgi:rhomboid protease GluP
MDKYDYAYEDVAAPPLAIPPDPVWVRLPVYPVRVSFIILGVLLLIWGGMTLYGNSLYGGGFDATQNPQLLLDFGMKDNALIVQGQYWRLITATLLHIGYVHMLLNGWALFQLGPLIERFYGPWRFLAIYCIAGLGGSIASFALSPVDSAGASGAIVGLLGAMVAYFWLHRGLTGAQGRGYLITALFNVGLLLAFGFAQTGVIDNWGHIGGLVAGAIAGLALVPRYRPGRYLNPNERLLEDTTPVWRGSAITAGLVGLSVLIFVVALARGGAQ